MTGAETPLIGVGLAVEGAAIAVGDLPGDAGDGRGLSLSDICANRECRCQVTPKMGPFSLQVY